MSNVLFDPIKTQAKVTDSVIVSFSGGKDAIVTLDLCCRYFKNVKAFFMYMCEGLEYQEKVLRWYENKYNIEILRVPHFCVSNTLKYGYFGNSDFLIPILRQNDIYNYARNYFEIEWIAGGERISDSIERRATIKKSGTINAKEHRFYPVAFWRKNEILQYIKAKRLYMSDASKALGNSAMGLDKETLLFVREKYPKDFEKIRALYPFIEVNIARERGAERFEKYGK